MNKSLLVIGGTGFFGKSVIDLYLRDGLSEFGITNLIIYSRNAASFPNKYKEFDSPKVKYVNGDISKDVKIPSADLIIHCASSTDIENYLDRPNKERQNIIESADNFVRLIKNNDKKTNVLYVSSGAVYGSRKLISPMDEEDLIDTSQMPPGKKEYADGKIAAEKIIAKIGEIGLNVAIARCFAFCGKYLPKDKHFAIGNFILQATKNERISVKTIDNVYRSYMHADDLVKWLITICLNGSPECPVFNVGSDVGHEIHQLAKTIGDAFGVGVDGKVKSEKIDYYVPSVRKAMVMLGLDLETDILTIVKKSM